MEQKIRNVWKTGPPPKIKILGVFTKSESYSATQKVYWNGEKWISEDGSKSFDYDPEYWLQVNR